MMIQLSRYGDIIRVEAATTHGDLFLFQIMPILKKLIFFGGANLLLGFLLRGGAML